MLLIISIHAVLHDFVPCGDLIAGSGVNGLDIADKGALQIQLPSGLLTVSDVYFVPFADVTLLSVKKITSNTKCGMTFYSYYVQLDGDTISMCSIESTCILYSILQLLWRLLMLVRRIRLFIVLLPLKLRMFFQNLSFRFPRMISIACLYMLGYLFA